MVLRWGHFRLLADGTWRTASLPGVGLCLLLVDRWTRSLRAGLLDAMDAPYLRAAQARGASSFRRLVRHAPPNALVPFLALVGTGSAALLAGAPIIETVFTWPGVGRYAVEAITARDVPVVQGFTLLAVAAYVVVSLIVDLVAMRLDRRLVTA
ncbi:ABC transporter permease subunit [Cryptosporangium sp. NPDC048952]|uniref:ABC transporter permease subunit n=1 Tax=Cryptosporangium sp. NPDC048952 TaxID=3363961 RepID=UPI0037147941